MPPISGTGGNSTRPARFGPFWRSDPPSAVKQILASKKIRGQPPRNYFKSQFPKVKAFDGTLPTQKTTGVEFWTDVPPDANGIPGKPTWSGPANANWHEIDVVITNSNP
jgi:hypothetical protein